MKDKDTTFDPARGALLSLPLMILLLVVGILPYQLIWGENSFSLALDQVGLWGFLLILFAGIVIHEGIHGLTSKLAGRLGWDVIKFGFSLKALAPYAHAKQPLPAPAYRLGALMPGMITGVLPVLIGTIWQLPVWAGFGAVLLSAACGDLLIWLRLLPVPRTAYLQDHPSRFGAAVVEVGND